MGKWVKGLLDRLFAVSGALIFMQLPMFTLQYTQQLAGRSSELKLQLNAIKSIATLNGKTMPEYIQKFTSANDPDFFLQGGLMENMMQRYTYLSNAEGYISNASLLAKPFVFFQNFDLEIAKITLSHFQFGLPLSLEGLSYGIAGVGFGCLLYFILNRASTYIYQTLRKARPTETSS